MSKLIPPPPPTVPIGRVNSKGEVIINHDWALYLTVGLLQRLGGYNSPDITELLTQSGAYIESDSGSDDSVFIPGPPGPPGAAGATGWLMMEEAPAEPQIIMPPGAEPPHGRYTPTLTNVANLDASTAYECMWVRHGCVVAVSGKIDVNPTAAGLVQLGISLPVASGFTAIHQLAGTAASPGVSGQSAAIVADFTNDRAEMQFTAVDLNNRAMYFTLMYWMHA